MSKKKRNDSYFAAYRRKKRKYMMIIIPVIIAVGATSAVAFLYQPPQAPVISGIECNRTEQLNYHIHAHLDVFVDGNKQQIPNNVGRLESPSCLYWLHTHSNDGLIHVESPQVREYTLGQFLDIWEQTADSAGFFDSIAGKNVKAYVDGHQFEGNYRDVPLESKSQITLVYGEPPGEIPDEFAFDVSR